MRWPSRCLAPLTSSPDTVVDIAGFPGTFFGTPLVTSSVIEKRQPGVLPAAEPTPVAEAMAGKNAGAFVKVRGTFAQYGKGTGFQTLTIESGGTTVLVYVYDWPVHGALPDLRPGSTLDVTGVSAIFYDAVGAPTSMIMSASGPEAIAVVDVPSWWTPARAVTALGVAAGVVLASSPSCGSAS